MQKKGQFFIIGAVVVLITLFSIMSVLNSDMRMDLSDVQNDNIRPILADIESGIIRTAAVSSPEDLKDNLDMFFALEKESVGSEYNLKTSYARASSQSLIKISIGTQNFFAEKTLNSPVNIPGIPFAPSTKKIVFISSENYDGDLNGLSGADEKCRDLANDADLPNHNDFKAWLSDSAHNARDRLTHSAIPYVLTNGVVVADNWDDLVALNNGGINYLQNTINTDENGVGHNDYVWTATEYDGVPEQYPEFCNNWHSNNWNELGGKGYSYDTRNTWTAAGYERCNSKLRIYCIQQ